MTDVTLKAILLGEDRSAGSALKKVGTEAEKSQSKLHSFGKVAGGVFAGLAAGVAAQKVGEFLKGSISAASQDQAAQRKLALALKNTTHASADQIASTQEWITKQSLATGVSKDDLMPAFQRLAESSGSVTKAQKEMKIAMDVSAGTGKNLATVSAAIMKANNGTTASLSRLGLKTKENVANTAAIKAAQVGAQTAQLAYNSAIKTYGKDSAQAKIAGEKLAAAHVKVGVAQKTQATTTLTLNQALDKMSKTFGGQAKAKAHSFDGTMQRLGTTWHELEVEVGNKLIPILQHLANWFLSSGLPALKGYGQTLEKHKTIVRDVSVAVVGFLGLLATYKVAVALSSAVTKAWTVVTKTAAAAQWLFNAPMMLGEKAALGTRIQLALLWAQEKIGAAITKGMAAAQWLLNAAMDANPIGLIVIAIGALVVGMVIAYKHSATFRAIVQAAFHAVQAAAQRVADFFTKDIPKAFDKVKQAASTALGWVKSHWPLILAILSGPFGLAVLAIAKNWGRIQAGATAVVGWFKQLPGKIGSALANLASTLYHVFLDGLQQAVKAELHGIGIVISTMRSLPGKVVSALGNLGRLLWNAGTQIISGLIGGIQSKIGDLTGALHHITSLIPIHKGPIEKDRVLLKPAGVAIMDGLIQGIQSRQVALTSVLSQVTAAVQAAGSKLQAAISARDSFAAGFQSFSTSVFGASYGTDANGNPIAPTADSILAYQKQQARQAHLVKKDVKALVHKGLSPALLKQLQSQGAAGMAEIKALASASPAQIAQLNRLNSQTASNLHGAGMVAGNSIYGSAIAKDQQRFNETKHLLTEIRDAVKGQNAKQLVARINGGDLEIALVHHQRVRKGGKKMAFQK